MTTASTTPAPAPKQPMSPIKKFFWAVGIILALLGIDHYTYNFAGIGADVTVTDSTVVVAPAVTPAPADTTKADTTKH